MIKDFDLVPFVLEYPDAIALLRKNGHPDLRDFADLNAEQEQALGTLVKEQKGTDLIVLNSFPTVVRPFYTEPKAEDPNYTNSFDLILYGTEI